MKKSSLLFTTLMLVAGFSLPVHAENAVQADMKAMGKSYKAATKANDIASLKTELTVLRDAAKKAQTDVPVDLQKQAADSPQRKVYSEGIGKLLEEIDAALALANAGKLPETKAALDKIKTLQRDYHKKLGV